MKTREELLDYINTVGLGTPAEVRRFTCPDCFLQATHLIYHPEPRFLLTCACGWSGWFARNPDRVLGLDLRETLPNSKQLFQIHPLLISEG